MTTNRIRLASLLAIGALAGAGAMGCGDDDGSEAAEAPSAAAEPAAETPEPAEPAEPEGEALPTETERMALNEGESEIPASIEVPTGCTTFNDDPTTIRIDHGDMGELFGVQVKEGNEFNTNHAEFASELAENRYGNTNEVLEQDDELLLWKVTREDSDHVSHNFRLIVELDGKQWVCTQGNYGGWSREEADRQIEACRTLTAI